MPLLILVTIRYTIRRGWRSIGSALFTAGRLLVLAALLLVVEVVVVVVRLLLLLLITITIVLEVL